MREEAEGARQSGEVPAGSLLFPFEVLFALSGGAGSPVSASRTAMAVACGPGAARRRRLYICFFPPDSPWGRQLARGPEREGEDKQRQSVSGTAAKEGSGAR